MTCVKQCNCTYNNKQFPAGSTVYTSYENGTCSTAVCKENGEISFKITDYCSTTTTTMTSTTTTVPTTTITVTPPSTITETFTITVTPPSTTTETPFTTTPTTPIRTPFCKWSEWFDNSQPSTDVDGKEIESISTLWKLEKISCERPDKIECMTNYDDKNITGENWKHDQVVSCNTSFGLLCSNIENSYEKCYNHLIRVLCCNIPSTSTTISTATTTTTVTPPSTTTETYTITTTVTPPSTTTEIFTTTTTTETSTPTTTVTPPSTTTKTSGTTPTTSVTTTTTCYCTYGNVTYPAGSTVYPQQDDCFTAYCNSSCHIVKKIRFNNKRS
ncbi:mucin-2 isoform X2 [Ctenopharyngodon idella]|uniref:mucin-2 isoform X2 n=1 Tax=Ctenopharyngodon idella TaxID=7959 RepID=UPI00222F87B2|nr:mucin-2 isoform X2 [Ctenopharyngodon idella]